MADIVMADILMADIVMASILMADIVMASIVMAEYEQDVASPFDLVGARSWHSVVMALRKLRP